MKTKAKTPLINSRIEQSRLPKLSLSREQLSNFNKTYNWVKKYFQKLEGKKLVVGGSELNHSVRVAVMGLIIAYYEKEDPYPYFIMGMLHDLGRAISSDNRSKGSQHGQLSKELAQDFLGDINLMGHNRKAIEDAIEDHPLLNEKVRDTIYVKILQDADRLESLSGYGPMKLGQSRWNLPVVVPKLNDSTTESAISSARQDLKRILEWEGMLWTKTAKRMAGYITPILRKLAEESDVRSNFIYSILSSLNIK